jgi:hypothetical protein
MLKSILIVIFSFQYVESQTNVFPTIMYQGRGCWYAWQDYLIVCSANQFQLWNTTSNVVLRQFSRDTQKTNVYINDDHYYLYEYGGIILQKFQMNGTKVSQITLPMEISVAHDVVKVYDGKLFYISTSTNYANNLLHIVNVTNGQLIKDMVYSTTVDPSNRWFVSNMPSVKFRH